jgi:hypothetical protein
MEARYLAENLVHFLCLSSKKGSVRITILEGGFSVFVSRQGQKAALRQLFAVFPNVHPGFRPCGIFSAHFESGVTTVAATDGVFPIMMHAYQNPTPGDHGRMPGVFGWAQNGPRPSVI